MSEVPRHERLLTILDLAQSLDDDAGVNYAGLPGQVDQLEKHNTWLHQLQEQTLALIEDNHLSIDALRRCIGAADGQ